MMITPKKWHKRIDEKINDTQYIIRSNKILSFLVSVALFPFTLLLSLFKIILIWILPISWPQFTFILKQYGNDIKEGLGHKTARKRARLSFELLTKGKEKHVSCGEENPDVTFFVIRPYYYMTKNELATSLSDLLFHYYRNLHQLSYALNNGWVPVVDWENYGPFRHAENPPYEGIKNCWEYYWCQPTKYTLEEVYRSKNVILANRNSVDYGYIPSLFYYKPYNNYAQRLALLCPKYDCFFKFNTKTEEYIESKYKELFPSGKRILGVAIRAMAYGSKIIKNHPIQPTREDLVEEVKNAFVEWNIDYIYFSCESEEYVNFMKSEFGEKLIVLDRRRFSKEPSVGQSDDKNELYQPGRKYQTNLDYLTEMALLSKCNSLIAGMTGGVRIAIIWNKNKYENIKILEGEEWKWIKDE